MIASTLRDEDRAASSLHLVAFRNGRSESFALPASGEVTLGRCASATIVLADGQASRIHARIHLGARCEIEDLGSLNGTRVRGARLVRGERVALAAGDGFEVGATVLLVQRRTEPPTTLVAQPAFGRAMEATVELCERVAGGDINVLLLGETGVGKEILAERIHAQSQRAKAPLLRLNCAALSPALLESELFGYERGAFTGAHAQKPGLLETADGGTVFLDEIAEMPIGLQAKLLRVLEERRLTRVGGLAERAIDVRFVAATNQEPARAIEDGRFRRDLYYRLAGVTVPIPPLRARRDEIEPLCQVFATRQARKLGRATPLFAAEARKQLLAHEWPGNVRELRNVVERAVLLCGPGPITPEHLQLDLGLVDEPTVSSDPAPRSSPTQPAPSDPLQRELAGVERARILAALESCAGNQSRAARTLGISRSTLLKRLGAYGVPRPRA